MHPVRGKAWRSGQEMRNVQLALPGSASGSTVTGSSGVTTGAGAGGQPGTGGLFPSQGGGGQPTTGGTGVVTPPGGGAPTGVPIPKTQSILDARTSINLCGAFEQWGLDPSTTLARAKVEFQNLSVQQIKQILQRLPSAFKATMEITYTEDQQ